MFCSHRCCFFFEWNQKTGAMMMMIMMRIKLDEHGFSKSHNDTMQVLSFLLQRSFYSILRYFLFYFPSPCTQALAACSIVETDKTPFFSSSSLTLVLVLLIEWTNTNEELGLVYGISSIIQKIVSTFSFIYFLFYKRLNHFFAFPLPSST